MVFQQVEAHSDPFLLEDIYRHLRSWRPGRPILSLAPDVFVTFQICSAKHQSTALWGTPRFFHPSLAENKFPCPHPSSTPQRDTRINNDKQLHDTSKKMFAPNKKIRILQIQTTIQTLKFNHSVLSKYNTLPSINEGPWKGMSSELATNDNPYLDECSVELTATLCFVNMKVCDLCEELTPNVGLFAHHIDPSIRRY